VLHEPDNRCKIFQRRLRWRLAEALALTMPGLTRPLETIGPSALAGGLVGRGSNCGPDRWKFERERIEPLRAFWNFPPSENYRVSLGGIFMAGSARLVPASRAVAVIFTRACPRSIHSYSVACMT
jgi:hypothetical protein